MERYFSGFPRAAQRRYRYITQYDGRRWNDVAYWDWVQNKWVMRVSDGPNGSDLDYFHRQEPCLYTRLSKLFYD